MTALDALQQFAAKFCLDVRPNGGTTEIWDRGGYSTDIEGNYRDEPPLKVAEFRSDANGNVTNIWCRWSQSHRTVIGQLGDFVKVVLHNQCGDPELSNLTLEYRKTGTLVEADIVSFSLNWWNYEQDGYKIQTIGSTEFHQGPDIRNVEAQLIYDQARNLLMSR